MRLGTYRSISGLRLRHRRLFSLFHPSDILRNTTSHQEQITITDMAFVLRRPFAISTCIKQLPKATASTTRAFHTSPKTSTIPSKPTSPIASLVKSRNAFQSSFRRSYMQQPGTISGFNTASLAQRLLYGAAIVGGTVAATNLIFNRETREDGGMPPFERQFLNETFMHTGLGVGIIGVAAQALHRSGWSYKLMTANPWLVMGVGLAASIGTMYGTFATSPDKYVTRPFLPNWRRTFTDKQLATSRNTLYGADSISAKPPSYPRFCSSSPLSSLERVSIPLP